MTKYNFLNQITSLGQMTQHFVKKIVLYLAWPKVIGSSFDKDQTRLSVCLFRRLPQRKKVGIPQFRNFHFKKSTYLCHPPPKQPKSYLIERSVVSSLIQEGTSLWSEMVFIVSLLYLSLSIKGGRSWLMGLIWSMLEH